MSNGDVTCNSKKTNLLIVGLLLLVSGVCFCPLINALPFRLILANVDPRYTSGQIDSIPFNRDLWMSRIARYRVGMARYLVHNKQLDGKTRFELIAMLGKPDVDEPGDEGMRWHLGYEMRGLFDETVWLELTIGEKGTASGAIVSARW